MLALASNRTNMDAKRVFDLAVELIDRIEVAHEESTMINISKNDDELFFVHDGNKEFVNPKHLSLAKHCEIKQLANFVRLYRDIDEENLSHILGMNKTKFQFLIEVKSVVPNLVEEIRTHDDEKYISYLYATNKMFPAVEHSSSC